MATTSASRRSDRDGGPGPGAARRTVTIRGQATPPRRTAASPVGTAYARRPARRPQDRLVSRPDRAAMYAVLLGVMLVLAAALSTHG